MMVEILTNNRIIIIGKTRSGKTHLAKSLLYMYPRIIVHDRKNEMYELMQTLHFSRVTTPEQLQTALNKGAKRVLYMPADPGEEDFDQVCHLVYASGNICLMVDEIASYTSSSQMPHWLGECLRLGAGRGIGMLMLTQRPRAIFNTLLSESEIVISFRLNLKTDRDKLKEIIGDDAETLRNLPYYHYMMYDGDAVTWCSPIPFDG